MSVLSLPDYHLFCKKEYDKYHPYYIAYEKSEILAEYVTYFLGPNILGRPKSRCDDAVIEVDRHTHINDAFLEVPHTHIHLEGDVGKAAVDLGSIFNMCEKNGEYVAVAAPSSELWRAGKDFCASFCRRYLKKEDSNKTNKIIFISHNNFSTRKSYRTLLWIGSADDLPDDWNIRNQFYARDPQDRPVYIIGPATINACFGKDMGSDFVNCRMSLIFCAGK